MPKLQEPVNKVRSDEAASTGNNVFHVKRIRQQGVRSGWQSRSSCYHTIGGQPCFSTIAHEGFRLRSPIPLLRLRWRLFVWLTLIVLASALEGVTLGLFLPIIAGTDSDSPLQRIFTSAFDNLGIQYTLPLALGAMTALYALRTALVITQEIFVARQIAGLMVGIKSRTVDQLLRADYQYFTKRGVGYFNNAATVEFTNLTNAFDYCTRAWWQPDSQ